MPALLPKLRSPAHQEIDWFLRTCRAPKLRTHREFFEGEFWLTTGPYADERAKVRRQPWTGHWLRQLDRSRWTHCNLTGGGQAGKSLLGLVEPLLFHLFEMKETVVFGVFDSDMADDKWKKDFLPVILRTRYREFLPRRGEGSEGGKLHNMVTFGNGASLKVMTGGGSDNSRSGFTSRVAVVTEANKLAESLQTGNETSKLNQIMARVRAFDTNYRVYTESTPETEYSPVHVFHQTGSQTRLIKPCPHCGKWVSPERADFVGWEGAEDVVTAMELGRFTCPECKDPYTDAERERMNLASDIVFRGQFIETKEAYRGDLPTRPLDDQYVVVGPEPRTLTFSLRFSAFDNQLASQAGIAKECWDGAQEGDQEVAEKKLTQFTWANPYKSPVSEEIVLQLKQLIVRQGTCGKGFVPAWCQCLTVGVDLRKRQLHYVVMAWGAGAKCQIIDYGVLSVRGDSLKLDDAILEALLELRDVTEAGWQWEKSAGKPGELRVPDAVWFDSKFGQGGVDAFVKEARTNRLCYRPIEGIGSSDYEGRKIYTRPKARTKNGILHIGESYHLERRKARGVVVVEIGVDYWKNEVHQALSIPAYSDGLLLEGAMVLFETKQPGDHLEYCRHQIAERQQVIFEPGKGERKVFSRFGANHFLDAAAYGSAAAHYCGIRGSGLVLAPAQPRESESIISRLVTPSGMPFFVGDRD